MPETKRTVILLYEAPQILKKQCTLRQIYILGLLFGGFNASYSSKSVFPVGVMRCFFTQRESRQSSIIGNTLTRNKIKPHIKKTHFKPCHGGMI